VRYVGAEPVFVDVDPATWCIDPACIGEAITRRTRGIIAVHLMGHPADMDVINKIAMTHGLWVVEDAAEAPLARYKGKIPETPYKHTSKGYFKNETPHAAYAAMISRMDAAVGTVVDELKKHGLQDNTLVIFTSDNGPAWERLGGTDSKFFNSAGPLRSHKGSAYEGGIREPFIACWPGKIPGGRVSDYIGGFQDVLPTLCDLTHVEKPTNIDGISIKPTLFNTGDQPEHKYLYWEFSGYNQQQAVREGKWKIIRSGVDIGDPAYELYDLSTDIGEKHNVAADHPDVVARLTKYAAEAHTPSKSFPLLSSEKPKGYKRVKDPTFTE